MVITDFLERNARLYGSDTALVEVNPSEERDSAVTWREASLIAEAQPDAPYRRELSWRDFDRRANRFANFLLSRGVERGTKVGILLMNCLEWLPIYFGILKAGCIAVPLNFRYASRRDLLLSGSGRRGGPGLRAGIRQPSRSHSGEPDPREDPPVRRPERAGLRGGLPQAHGLLFLQRPAHRPQ